MSGAVSRGARAGDEVEVNLFISSSHSSEVDIRENFTFTLGKGELLPPIEHAIMSLSEGQSKQITFPIAPFFKSEEAAMISGFNSVSEVLTVDISVLSVIDTTNKATGGLLPKEELLAIATTKKELANSYLKESKPAEAVSAYTEAVTVLRSLGGEWPQGQLRTARISLEVVCLCNLAHVHIGAGNFYDAIKCASEALALDRLSVKAWYRRGVANWRFGEIRKARADLYEAAKLEPGNPEIRKALENVDLELKSHSL